MKRTLSLFPSFLRSLFHTRTERYRSIEEDLLRRGYSYRRLITLVGYAPRREDLFLEALIHRSFLPIVGEGWESNERLEFLGDSILSMIVAEDAFRQLPDYEEGHLTKVRARLVNRNILAETARSLQLHTLLLISSSAAQSLEQGADSMLADGYEALIGAIYLDAGLPRARRFVEHTLLEHNSITQLVQMDDNHKSVLLEHSQRLGKGMPRYEVLKEIGPEHDRSFTVQVSVDDRPLGTGTGKNKKSAEQAAALEALKRLKKNRQ